VALDATCTPAACVIDNGGKICFNLAGKLQFFPSPSGAPNSPVVHWSTIGRLLAASCRLLVAGCCRWCSLEGQLPVGRREWLVAGGQTSIGDYYAANTGPLLHNNLAHSLIYMNGRIPALQQCSGAALQ